MKPFKIFYFLLLILTVVAFIGLWYFRGSVPGPSAPITYQAPGVTSTPTPSIVPYKVQEFVSGLTVPWSIVFTSPTRMLVTERTGDIRIIENGKLLDQPLYTFSDVASGLQEGGLMGLAVHPYYGQNKYLYASYNYKESGKIYVKIVRLIDQGHSAKFDRVIIDKIPGASMHTASRIKFGPDGFLYITTGDSLNRNLAQDKNSLAGKLLRLNDDGSIPSGNPFPGSPIYSYGHRNSEGITWQPGTGRLFSTEHGPSGFDGPGGGDELNIIEAGRGYGWPLVSHEQSTPGQVSPIQVWTPAVAPASAEFYSGKVFPQFYGNLFFGGLVGQGLFRVVLDSSGQRVASWEKLPDVDLGRIRDVATGPDGYLYFSTSNRDGRGKVRPGDDKIMRLIPAK